MLKLDMRVCMKIYPLLTLLKDIFLKDVAAVA